jgi:DNA-binding NtrC family response regulator
LPIAGRRLGRACDARLGRSFVMAADRFELVMVPSHAKKAYTALPMQRHPFLSSARTVVCVEDDSDLLEIMCRALRSADVVAIGATTAEAALALIEQHPVDLILTDLHLPDRDGLEFIRALRAAGVNAPVVVMTGQGSTHVAMAALEVGASAYLQKPVDVERLQALLREYAPARSE